MLVAIPAFGSRISPRFDCAPQFVFVEMEDGRVGSRREESVSHLHWRTRIALLMERKVDVLLCGGIRRCDFLFLAEAGVKVCAGLVGMVDDVLEAFTRGELSPLDPGGPGFGAGRRRRGAGRGRQT